MRFRGVHHAVFFFDPTGIRWELAFMPRIPMPWDRLKTLRMAKVLSVQHPEWKHHPAKEMLRGLPSRNDLG
jgi:hypothetical protein